MAARTTRDQTDTSTTVDADAVLIGAGVMSATLAVMLTERHPDWRIVVVERACSVATESSDVWNNAGTGHSGNCELNYMPDPDDPRTPIAIAQHFARSRQWWDRLESTGALTQERFLTPTPHMAVVFGEHDVEYLRRRHETLRRHPEFAGLQFSDDPATIAKWAPLVTEGRGDTPIAATRAPNGTDVDFGSLTGALLDIATQRGVDVRVGHRVSRLVRGTDNLWTIGGRVCARRFRLRAPFVFVGAGGMALRLLQSSGLPEVRGYAVLPVGAAFLRCSNPAVVARHNAKVYGQARVGAPPMSVPHLDRRHVGGTEHLMFGPYPTLSTKLLTSGHLWDFFATVRPHNLRTILGALRTNVPLIRYLVRQLAIGRRGRLAELRRYYPTAEPADWELIPSGQRAQLVTPDPRVGGVIWSGTEVVVGDDGSIASLLGASPGASTAVSIMDELIERTGL